MATVTAIKSESFSPSALSNEELSDRIVILARTACQSLSDLKPLVEEAWLRLERGQTVCDCKTKVEFAEKVLGRTDRAVRYMLDGGNRNRTETVSVVTPAPPQAHPSNRELRRIAFKQEHPEFDGKKNKEVDNAIRKENFTLPLPPPPAGPRDKEGNPQHPPTEPQGLFLDLFDILHRFEPTWSDGDEHVFVTKIEQAISTPAVDDVTGYKRGLLTSTLERVSVTLSNYAKRMKETANEFDAEAKAAQ